MRRQRLRLSAPTLACLLSASASCGGSNGGDIAGLSRLEGVNVSPTRARAAVGGTIQFTATAFDAGGSAIASGVAYVWSSTDPRVVTVGQTTGLAKGTGLGAAAIRVYATAEGQGAVQGEARIGVEEIANVVLNPDSVELHVGEDTTLVARASFSDGSPAPGVPYRWRNSSGETVALVDAQGSSVRVHAVAPGMAGITVNAVPGGRLGHGAISTITVLGVP